MDIELVKSARKGNKQDFEKLILEIQNDLFKIAMLRLNNNYEDANDAIQNTVLKAYKNIKKLRKLENFKTWIIRILMNECSNIVKENRRFTKIKDKSKSSSDLSYEDIYDDEDVKKYLKGISNDELTIINLYYHEKYSYKEISNITKTNINTLKSTVLRAKEKIKKNIIEEGDKDNEKESK